MGITGKTIVFTGKISQPRHIFQAMVESHGGIASSDISSKTDYLVVGEKPGSKLIRASMLGIKTISEQEFLKLLEEVKEQETPLSSEELKELDKHLVERTCFFCKRVTKQFDTCLDYDTCFMCETKEIPKCPNCGYDNPTFITDFKLYHCINCWKWFKAPYSWNAHKSKHGIHFWYKISKKKNGDKIEECTCGAVYITHPNGKWEKHEPSYIIEQGKKEAHEYSVEEEQRIHREKQEKKERLQEFFNSLTPSQQYLLEND